MAVIYIIQRVLAPVSASVWFVRENEFRDKLKKKRDHRTELKQKIKMMQVLVCCSLSR